MTHTNTHIQALSADVNSIAQPNSAGGQNRPCAVRAHINRHLGVLFAALVLCTGSAAFAAVDGTKHFDIKAEPLPDALMEFGVQSGLTVVAPSTLTAGKQASSVRGDLTPSDALGRLLRGSGLTFARAADGSIAIQAISARGGPVRASAASGSYTVTTNSELEEIVVTAQKRESTVLKTPISMTAITGQDLLSRGLDSAQGIVQAVPGIAVISAGPGQAQYEIRGLSASGGESPTIGFYLDEAVLTPPSNASTGKSEIDPDLYDLERVEVLRGPQGTLYGAGSLGGTVKLITNPPDLSGFYGSSQTTGSGTAGGGANYSEKAMVNLPLIDETVALRVVGDFTHNSGWIDRIVVPNFPPPNPTGPRGNVLASPASAIFNAVNDEDLYGVRATLLIKATDALTIKGTVFYQRITQNGMNAYDNPPGTLAHYQPFDVPEPYSDKFTIYGLSATYVFQDFTLTSASAYWTRRSSQFQDFSEQVADYLGLPGYSIASGGIGPADDFENDSTHEYSQELRLASNGGGPFQWIVGGYYSSYFDNLELGSIIPGLASLFGTTNLAYGNEPLTVKQKAAFVHASYELGLGFKLEAGARYFSYQTGFTDTSTGLAFGGGPVITGAAASDSGVNPMVNLSWSPSSHLLVYASAAKGFREGAGNPPVPTNSQTPEGAACAASLSLIGLSSAPTSYGPDTDWSYEVGEKARLFDGRLILNSDIFYTIWSKVQTPVALTCGYGFTANGPQAKVRGGEMELEAQLAKGLTLSQGVGFANAAYSENYPAANVVNGQPLFDAPRWTISTGLRYERSFGPYALVGQAQNSYQSHSFDLSYEINNVPSRDLTNLRLGLETKKWSAYLFANNVFNVHAVLENMNLLLVTGPNFNRVATNQPLTAGVEVGVHF
jgi:iron complex outermembrane recepter protein